MLVLFSFCDFPYLFTWLLPFLLGLGIGWLYWGKYKSMVGDLEAKLNEAVVKIAGLESDLETCKKARMECEGNVSMLRGKMREMEVAAGASGAIAVGLASTAAGGSGTTDRWFTAIGTDKLQIIEGIGPKMEEVLKDNGISNFTALAAASSTQLREILNKYGDKYRIIDPNTWPQQAGLAHDRKWNALIDLQKTLDTGRSDTATDGHTDSKLEKWLIKAGVIRRWAQDDLKAIEGIGPKIEELLHNAGIKTWKSLSETSEETIQGILKAAGPRYALAVPGTWPKQAEMAAAGQWDELQAYQDFLNAGKEK